MSRRDNRNSNDSYYDDSTASRNPHNDYDNDTNYTGDDYTYDDGQNSYYSRPSSYSTRGTERYPAPQEQYQDEYDSDEDTELHKNDEYYQNYDDGRNAYDSTSYRVDEAEEEKMIEKQRKKDERDANRGKKIVAAICCCCCCLITILVLILVLVVFKEKERLGPADRPGAPGFATPKPTPRPTYPIPPALRPSLAGDFNPWQRDTDPPTISPYPTAVASSNPTPSPTITPTTPPTISPAPTKKVPPQITLTATHDTYVFVDGFFQYEAFGEEDSFLVQNGLAEYYEFADALGLIAFDLSELPSKEQLRDYESQAMLKLNHNPVAPQFNSRVASIIEIRKLVSTPMRIETIHGGMLNKEPEGSILGENKFTVGVNQATVQVDISDLLYPENFTDTGYDKNQLFLMLINNSTEQGDSKWTELQFQDQAGDRFKSVESGEGPTLTITYNAAA